jgi:hypothetical protein
VVTGQQRASTRQGVAVPQWLNCNGYFKLAIGQVGTGHMVAVHRPRGGGDHLGQPPKTALSGKSGGVTTGQSGDHGGAFFSPNLKTNT